MNILHLEFKIMMQDDNIDKGLTQMDSESTLPPFSKASTDYMHRIRNDEHPVISEMVAEFARKLSLTAKDTTGEKSVKNFRKAKMEEQLLVQDFMVPQNPADIFYFIQLAVANVEKYQARVKRSWVTRWIGKDRTLLKVWTSKLEEAYKQSQMMTFKTTDRDYIELIYRNTLTDQKKSKMEKIWTGAKGVGLVMVIWICAIFISAPNNPSGEYTPFIKNPNSTDPVNLVELSAPQIPTIVSVTDSSKITSITVTDAGFSEIRDEGKRSIRFGLILGGPTNGYDVKTSQLLIWVYDSNGDLITSGYYGLPTITNNTDICYGGLFNLDKETEIGSVEMGVFIKDADVVSTNVSTIPSVNNVEIVSTNSLHTDEDGKNRVTVEFTDANLSVSSYSFGIVYLNNDQITGGSNHDISISSMETVQGKSGTRYKVTLEFPAFTNYDAFYLSVLPVA